MYYERFGPEARAIIDAATEAAIDAIDDLGPMPDDMAGLGRWFRRRRRGAEPVATAPAELTPGELEALAHAALAAQQGRGVTGLGELGIIPLIIAAVSAAIQVTQAKIRAAAAKRIAKIQAEQAAAQAAIDKKISDEFIAQQRAGIAAATGLTQQNLEAQGAVSSAVTIPQETAPAKEGGIHPLIPVAAVGAGVLALTALT